MSETPAPTQIDETLLDPAVTLEWQRYTDNSSGVVINKPGLGQITGTLTDDGDPSTRSLYVDMFRAEQPGNGAGQQLLELLKNEGQIYGASTLSGHFTSPAALGAFLHTIEPGSITFTLRASGQPAEITPQEALKQPELYIASGSIITSNEPTQ